MIKKNSGGKLTAKEKKIVKALLNKGERNQDIQHLINTGRKHTINGARITEVKQNSSQTVASEAECQKFILNQESYDPTTGLRIYTDERLIRAREAMKMAVSTFNNPAVNFKSHTFSVLAHIAWTYAMHQYFLDKNEKILNEKNNQTLALSTLLKNPACPLDKATKANLIAIIKIRNEVEHRLLESNDDEFNMLFQACALNFNEFIRQNFGEKVALDKELGFAIQFATFSTHQLSETQKTTLPSSITSFSSELNNNKKYSGDLKYRFQVIYTLEASPKSLSNIKFVKNSDAGETNTQEVLIKEVLSDDKYPHLPMQVVDLVKEKTGKKFTSHDHTVAWKKHKARPATNSSAPEVTKKKYCVYHKTNKNYSYNDAWVDFLVENYDN